MNATESSSDLQEIQTLRRMVERLIIENRNSLNDPTTNEPYDVKGIADDVVALIQKRERAARIDELKSITGFSNVGGVYTKAGVDTSAAWLPIKITDRLTTLSNNEGEL